MRPFFFLAAAALAVAAAGPSESQTPLAAELTYADLADLALDAQIVAHVRIADATRLEGAQAAAVPADLARFYIEAELISLIKSSRSLPARLHYVVDLPRDSRGRAPKPRKKSEFLLLAAPAPGRADAVQLVAPDAQIPWSAERADRLRAIVKEAASADAAPRITGIGRAFHVPGALAGESETQIFLQTEDRQPVSLTILRRPGQTPQWAVALSEIVDEAAEPPQHDSLLWYRLACSLPPALPRQSYAEADAESATAIEADYRFLREQLGPCRRTRARR